MLDLERQYRNNRYVKNISGDKIIYNESFYRDLFLNLEKGMSDIEAYEELGFDTEVLGVDRAYACARRAREKAKEPKVRGVHFDVKPGTFRGDVKRDNLEDLTKDELLAYYAGRTMYLEAVERVQKKTRQILAENSLSDLMKK